MTIAEIILEKWKPLSDKLKELESKANAGMAEVAELKELSKLQEIAELFVKRDNYIADACEYRDMAGRADSDFAENCKGEAAYLELEAEDCEKSIFELLMPRDPNDSKDAIIEIRGGVGGEEGNLFARDLYEMYQRYAGNCDLHTELLELQKTEAGGINFVAFRVEGINAYSFFKYESGVHRVQRVPETEAKGRIHTSTATVLVVPELELEDFKLDLNEVEIVPCHASGAGGQHINKTSSAIRATHIPTGIVAFSQGRRSQLQNKDEALRILASRVAEKYASEKEEKEHTDRKIKLGTGERSEKIRTYNYPQNRVTDHRIGYSNKQLDKVMLGNLDDIINQLKQTEIED